MLRPAVQLIAVAIALLGLWLLRVGRVPGLQLLLIGLVTFVAVRYESWRKGAPPPPAGPEWQPTGERFDGLLAYRKLLVSTPQRQRQLARNLAGQLILYSTGAPVGFADRAAVERILDDAGGNNPGVRALIEATVRSPLFGSK